LKLLIEPKLHDFAGTSFIDLQMPLVSILLSKIFAIKESTFLAFQLLQ
jgi:hypothetical protein